MSRFFKLLMHITFCTILPFLTLSLPHSVTENQTIILSNERHLTQCRGAALHIHKLEASGFIVAFLFFFYLFWLHLIDQIIY